MVQAEPLSGVAAGVIFISTAAVAPGYIGQPYSATLVAGGGVAPRSFSLTAGAPPRRHPGEQWQLERHAYGSGKFPFHRDRHRFDPAHRTHRTRNYVLTVSVDTVPVITTPATLPRAAVAAAIRKTQRHRRRRAARLDPHLRQPATGIQLGGGGALIGSALTAGNYTFSVRVDDADVPADSDSRTFTLSMARLRRKPCWFPGPPRRSGWMAISRKPTGTSVRAPPRQS